MTNTVSIGFIMDADGSFTLPADITGTLQIEIWGQGANANATNAGGGGGAGGYSKRNAKVVSPSDTISWTAFGGGGFNEFSCDGMTVTAGSYGSTGPSGAGGLGGTASGGDVNTNGGNGANGTATDGGNGGSSPNGGIGGAGGGTGVEGAAGALPGAGTGGSGLGVFSQTFDGGQPLIKFTFEITGDSFVIPPFTIGTLDVSDLSTLSFEGFAPGGNGYQVDGSDPAGYGGGGGAYGESTDVDVSSYTTLFFQMQGQISVSDTMGGSPIFFVDGGHTGNSDSPGAGGLAANCIADTALNGNDGNAPSGSTGGSGGNAATGGGTGGAGGTNGNPGSAGSFPGGGGGSAGDAGGAGGASGQAQLIITFSGSGSTGNPWYYYAQQ